MATGDSGAVEEALRGWLKTDRPWRIEKGANPKWTFAWRVACHAVSFSFSRIDVDSDSPSGALMERWVKCLPLFAGIVSRNPGVIGETAVNWGDSAWRPGLGFSARSPDVRLIPDVDLCHVIRGRIGVD
jgi:hypothetical protein